MPSSNASPVTFLNDKCPQSFFFCPITQEEVIDILYNIPTGKTPGFDDLNDIVIKHARHGLAKPLVHIFNRSLSSGIFPDGLETGKITPIHKGGYKHNIGNYRPISILTTFSKVFEKLVQTRMMNFIDKHLISDSQFGFRKNHSTEQATSFVVNKFLKAFDDKTISIGIFWTFPRPLTRLIMIFCLLSLNTMAFVVWPWTGSEVTCLTEVNLLLIILLARQSKPSLVESPRALSQDHYYLLYI